ncbi:hypothetical protein NP233_g5796 [Leucocoprinus birnbaumii]|uniref:Uncharacterized protein n=1 Tax=Leucocoprinus birnbaumii TaxID=56174 RepID=A0AAD5VS61_9AGAR|nr:hypothetical protein NP233_g5796 [Leucocoprinus birnbaumii]
MSSRRHSQSPSITSVRRMGDIVSSIDAEDIYREDGRQASRPSTPTTIHSTPIASSWSMVSSDAIDKGSVIMSSSLSRTSSSSSDGEQSATLITRVEQAITRWATGAKRLTWAWKSTSLSRTHSRASSWTSKSFNTAQASLYRTTSMQTMSSEKEIVARINRMKVLEESRQTPREFVLYLPPSLSSSSRRNMDGGFNGSHMNHTTHTSSIAIVLARLDVALRRAKMTKRHSSRRLAIRHSKSLTTERAHRIPSSGTGTASVSASSPQGSPHTGIRRRRASLGNVKLQAHVSPATHRDGLNKRHQAWFLNVASPTWDDLIAIGKLLHLHPMTLDNILQQDTREKFDVFPKLGYYFVSFRSLPVQPEKVLVGETMIYLVVFRDGICCFHYKDVGELIDGVRNRIPLFEDVASLSADWIVHALIDSIVDSFSPLLEEAEREVLEIEDIVFAAAESEQPKKEPTTQMPKPAEPHNTASSRASDLPHSDLIPSKTRSELAPPETPPISDTMLTLRRMVRVRRLVTSLSRLLSRKSQVVRQIRKRLLKIAYSGGEGGARMEELDVAMYMGDVQDHILTMQSSLEYYERMLSNSHPTYVLSLSAGSSGSRVRATKTWVIAQSIIMGVYLVAPVIGQSAIPPSMFPDASTTRTSGASSTSSTSNGQVTFTVTTTTTSASGSASASQSVSGSGTSMCDRFPLTYLNCLVGNCPNDSVTAAETLASEFCRLSNSTSTTISFPAVPQTSVSGSGTTTVTVAPAGATNATGTNAAVALGALSGWGALGRGQGLAGGAVVLLSMLVGAIVI